MFELQRGLASVLSVDDGPAPLRAEVDLPGGLERRYAELRSVDEALRDAEQRLRAAHFVPRVREDGARRIQQLYEDVLALRTRSRRMLDDLADIWVAED